MSLPNSDASPIVTGRFGKPVESGYKARSPTTPTGSCSTTTSTSATARRAAARPRHRPDRPPDRQGPRAVTADRGYGEAGVDDTLTDLGVAKVVVPRKGKPSAARRAVEHEPGFRRLIKWRTGAEGRISALKRGHGMDRTRFDGIAGAKTWVGHGVFTPNLIHFATLT